MENKELIGKKILGFKFRDRVGIKYNDCMGTCVGKIGIIRKYDEKQHSYSVKFSDGEIWFYPAELIEQHIVKEPQEPKYVVKLKDIVKLNDISNYLSESITNIQEPQEPNKIYTIQDLKEGKCAVLNDGTMEELDFLLFKAVNRSAGLIRQSKVYIINKDSVIGMPDTDLPKQSVKEFLKEIELGSQGQNVIDNVLDVQEPNTIEGIKESNNKINIEYDWDFLKAQMNRMAKNKHKYPKNNWKKPMDIEQLKDALFRHVLEVMDNKFEDDGDEFGHLSAIALNAMMINYQLKNK